MSWQMRNAFVMKSCSSALISFLSFAVYSVLSAALLNRLKPSSPTFFEVCNGCNTSPFIDVYRAYMYTSIIELPLQVLRFIKSLSMESVAKYGKIHVKNPVLDCANILHVRQESIQLCLHCRILREKICHAVC